jgi:hypothetical protein
VARGGVLCRCLVAAESHTKRAATICSVSRLPAATVCSECPKLGVRQFGSSASVGVASGVAQMLARRRG